AAEIAGDDHRRRRRALREETVPRFDDEVAATLRAWIVERGDEIGGSGGVEAAQDLLARGEEIGERDATEVVADERASGGRGRLHRGDAGMRLDRDAARGVGYGARTAGLEQLVDKRGHGIDLAVAGADERDDLAGRGELE